MLSPSRSVSLIYKFLQRSPTSGLSILITLAPKSASLKPAYGPDKNWLNSNTVNPSNGLVI